MSDPDARFAAWVSEQMRLEAVHRARNRLARENRNALTEPGLRLAAIAAVRPPQSTPEGEAFLAAVVAMVAEW